MIKCKMLNVKCEQFKNATGHLVQIVVCQGEWDVRHINSAFAGRQPTTHLYRGFLKKKKQHLSQHALSKM